ncbi:MAG: hydroxyacid dehydrogenase [Rhodospirillaceae bacterium]|nr:hydroxyacid dehydrogenase [Rhodospirillaceae bacterium]
MSIKAHIVAFNANEYCDLLAPMFPEVEFTFDLARGSFSDPTYECEILISFGLILKAEIFRRNKKLRWVQTLGTGTDGVDDQPDLVADAILTSMRGIHAPQMTEMAFLMMLALNRDLPKMLDNQRGHVWQRWPGLILEGKTIAVLGLGLIAEALVTRCKAFDMKVVGITGTPRLVEGFDEIRTYDDLPGAVADADYVLVLTPNKLTSKRLVDAEPLAAMKPTAFLINLARGGIIDEGALIEAIQDKQIAGAGLDVFDAEPLPEDSPLWSLDNVIITPHMGGMSEAYVRQAMVVLEHNMRAYLDGRPGDMINRFERQ